MMRGFDGGESANEGTESELTATVTTVRREY
jgi:hypothetical protein